MLLSMSFRSVNMRMEGEGMGMQVQVKDLISTTKRKIIFL